MYRLLYTVTYVFNTVRTWFVWGAGAARQTRIPPAAYTILHFVLVAVVVLLLGYFSPKIVPIHNVPGTDSPLIKRYFCGIVALVIYALVRAAIYVVRLLMEREEEFDDIRRAWETGLAALDRAGLDLQWLPVFLVVGAADEEESLFRAARTSWKANAPGREEAAPVRLYATEEAIYVSCPGVGTLAAQRDVSPEAAPAAARAAASDHAVTLDPSALGGGDGQATLDPAMTAAPALAAGVSGGVTGTLVPGGAAQTLLPSGGSGILRGMLPGTAARPAGGTVQRVRPLSQAESDLASRRFEFLCRLISETRGDFCPANGMLLVLPLSWAELTPGPETDRVFGSVGTDVETAREALGLAFPATVAFTGLERVTGLRQFVDRGGRSNQKFQDTRAGSKFPPGTAIDGESARWAVDAGLHWFQEWCYSLFAQGIADGTNRQLYQLLCDLQSRRAPLARLLQLAFEGRSGATAARVSGVYYCASGRGERERAFVQGVFKKLIDSQDEVAWTAERLHSDRTKHSLAYAGLAASAAVLVADGALVWMLVGRG